MNPERVLLAGDTHRDGRWFDELAEIAAAKNCPVILQLGDFGYWEHTGNGIRFLEQVETSLARWDLTCVWIDGNHENHRMLRDPDLYQPRPDGFVEIRPRLLHAPRGQRWTWQGQRFLALGGAYSVDKNRRRPGESWWPEETIADTEAFRCIADGPADVMVTHDAPWGADGVMGSETGGGDKDRFPESTANRLTLGAVVAAVQPRLLVHGHYHHRNTTTVAGTLVEGFARDWMGSDAWAVLDVAALRVLDG